MKFKEIDTQERFDFAIGEATALLKILSGQAIEDEDFDEEDEFEDEEEIFDELVTQLESALLYILDENYDYSNQEYYHQDYTEMWVEGLIKEETKKMKYPSSWSLRFFCYYFCPSLLSSAKAKI